MITNLFKASLFYQAQASIIVKFIYSGMVLEFNYSRNLLRVFLFKRLLDI